MQCPKPVKQKKKAVRGLSDSNLLSLRRKVCWKRFEGKCFVCGKVHSEMEDHHAVKRNVLLLKYDYRNSFLVGKWAEEGQSMSCHQFCDTPAGRFKIDQYWRFNGWHEYIQERAGRSKDWFSKYGITRNQYLQGMKEELETILQEDL